MAIASRDKRPEWEWRPIKSDEDLEAASRFAENCSEWLATREDSQLTNSALAVMDMISSYQNEHYPSEPVAPRDMLHHLMEINGLAQSDLVKEIGSQSVVSRILKGQRELDHDQILRLSARFKVSPDLFATSEQRSVISLVTKKEPEIDSLAEFLKEFTQNQNKNLSQIMKRLSHIESALEERAPLRRPYGVKAKSATKRRAQTSSTGRNKSNATPLNSRRTK